MISPEEVAKAFTNQLFQLLDLPHNELLNQRDLKFRKMGTVEWLVAQA